MTKTSSWGYSQPLQGLCVFLLCFLHDMRWQRWRRRSCVPVKAQEMIPHILFIEAFRYRSRLITLHQPKAR